MATAAPTTRPHYLDNREAGERFVDTYRRIGMKPFKDVLYA